MAVTRRKAAAPPVEPESDAFEELDELEETPAKPAKRTRRKAAPAPVEELSDDEDDEGDEPPAKPVKRAARKTVTNEGKSVKAAPEPPSEFNTAWAAEYVSEATGVDYDGRSLRMILRKMAADGDLDRTVGEDRGRYTFPKGANDPTIKKLIAKIKSGDTATTRRTAVAEEDEVEEPPAPRRSRKATATKAAPAKATASRRTRRASAE